MSDIDLVVFDLAGTTVRDADNGTVALAETLGSLGLPIPFPEVESLRDKPAREAIQELLLRYSPEQAEAETIDRLATELKRRLKGKKKPPTVRALEGAEELFRWLRQRSIKVVLTAELDRKTVNHVTTSLKWNDALVNAVVCSEDVQAGPPAPFLIFRAMERTGSDKVARVAVVATTARDLEAGAKAEVGMNVGLWSGGESKEKLQAAPHTHLIESIRKFPSLLARPSAMEAPPPAAEVAPQPAAAAPAAAEPPPPPKPPAANPSDPLGPGFKMGSKLEG